MLLCFGLRFFDNFINEDFVLNLFLYLMLIEYVYSFNWVYVFFKVYNYELRENFVYIIFIN